MHATYNIRDSFGKEVLGCRNGLELEVRDRTWVERIVLPGSNFRARY